MTLVWAWPLRYWPKPPGPARRRVGTGLDTGLRLRAGTPEHKATAGLPGCPKPKGSLGLSRLPFPPPISPSFYSFGIVEEGDIVLRSAEPDQSFFERPFTGFALK